MGLDVAGDTVAFGIVVEQDLSFLACLLSHHLQSWHIKSNLIETHRGEQFDTVQVVDVSRVAVHHVGSARLVQPQVNTLLVDRRLGS